MHLLSFGNSKLKKDNIFSFGIPAGMTCPAKGECAKGCYAMQGFFVMPTVKNAQLERYKATKTQYFVSLMHSEIQKRKVKTLRIHDSGDFYSQEYLDKWIQIINLNPDTLFYAYTKNLPLFLNKELPKNFVVIFSQGGIFDNMINKNNHRHSRVFLDEKSLLESGYANASESDIVAINNYKVGLIYHGAKGKQWVSEKSE